MTRFLENLLIFGRLLRALGLDVHVGRMLDVMEALQHVDVGSRDEVYHTCRTLLVHRHDDLDTFDAAFDAFWRDHGSAFARREGTAGEGSRGEQGGFGTAAPSHVAGPPSGRDREAEGQAPLGILRIWSDVDALADKDFAAFTAEEIALARMVIRRLVWSPGERRTRQWVAGRGSRVDLRRALAQAVRTGGDVVTLPRRRRRMAPRPVVLLCDVSGSMEHYSRMLLQFVYEMGRRHRRFEAFLFSTRLTRITKALRRRHVGAAVDAVSRSVPDWSGGTRIGEALRAFHQQWSRVVLHRGPVVLLISDGWDRGDPDVLRDQMARLRRSCHRLIWLNPLIGTRDYAPLTRGLVAALPFVDDLLPARTLTNLADLAVHLNALTSG